MGMIACNEDLLRTKWWNVEELRTIAIEFVEAQVILECGVSSPFCYSHS